MIIRGICTAAAVMCALGIWDKLSFGTVISRGVAADRIINSVSPVIKATAGDTTVAADVYKLIDNSLKFLIGFVPREPYTIIEAAAPVCGASEKRVDAIKTRTEDGDDNLTELSEGADGGTLYGESADVETEHPYIAPENQAPIKSINASQKTENSVGNETSYSIDTAAMLSMKPDIDMSVSGPKILITHTHATEAYSPDGAEVYDVTASDRDRDTSKNVVAVGDEMERVFKAKGIEVIHDRVLHDEPSFNGSYAHSLAEVEATLEKYPSVQIVFDIHRDSIVYEDKTKAKTVTDVGGKSAAQLMFVVGTDEKGLYNPDWRQNMIAALHFQKAIYQKYPTLMRHINLRKERFNGHTTNASVIIETGTSGNSLSEAKYAISLAAECIADYLLEL